MHALCVCLCVCATYNVFVVFLRSVLVKRMFRQSDEDLCPSPHKQIKEETHKRGTRKTAAHLIVFATRSHNLAQQLPNVLF